MSRALTVPAEVPAIFECAERTLVGVLHPAGDAADVGVVVVVGGPQYRVGSHRQFVLTARALAAAGYPVLRFDYRGMGDSEGESRNFDDVSDDIRSAIDYLSATQRVAGVVVYGLCDAASAALIYGSQDSRVRGLILLNPWVRTPEGEARSFLRHYYLDRLLGKAFWRKVLSGEFSVGKGLSDLWANYVASRSHRSDSGGGCRRCFIERMRDGLAEFSGHSLFLISGHDLTAREFMDHCRQDARWKAAMARHGVSIQTLPKADHTFSQRAELDNANLACVEWLQSHWSRSEASDG